MVDRQIGSRRHVPIAPAINIQHQDLARYGQGSGPHTDRQSPQASRNSNGNQLNISSPPMRIPGTKPTSNVPRALPPPPHINHVSHNGTDLGWLWANQDKDMKPEPTSRPASPRSISAVERRDSESTFDEDTRRRKSSSATIASMRSPRFVDSYDTGVVGYHRDQLSSPSQHPGDTMRTSHRPNIPQTNAYDDMVKRKIGGGGSSSSISTPGRPQKPNSYDIPSRSLLSTELQPHKTLALRSLSLQDNPSPASPRKLSSSNNPHWDPESVSVLTSPSIISSRQSYYSDARASPTNDVFSTATSMTSYGGSGGGSSNMQSKFFGEIGSSRISPQALQSHSTRESGLSLAMMAQSNASSPTSISPLYSSAFQQTGHSPGRQGPGVEYVGINNFKPEHQDQKSGESSSRNMRPPYLQEEVVILPPHPSDHLSHYHNNHPNRHTMKRKGAPDLSERDGPPSQQLQQEGRRSPNPITLPYTSPQSNSFAPSQHQQQQHISSSIDRLPPSVNPLSDPNQDRNSPYPGQLNIDPVLNSTAHPYPLDGPQLAAQAAQLISVENPVSSKELNTSSMTGNTPLSCECCPKKPRRFNSEAELRAHMNEKQYVCSFCHNRFKNKNEMERHQASLHLRDRSWSCAALERNHDAAFHQSPIIPPIIPGHTQPPLRPDVCGYCGQQFPNPPDYLARADHLSNVHKFADCNQSKKFWRADHFRQHLKHSHGGIPGKWTNMLEQACIKMEISPLPQHQHPHGGGGGGGGGDDGSHMAQQQAAHAAIVAQAAADQAQRAVQQQVQQAHQHQHQQQQQHHNHNHHPAPPPLSSYQATQLQNATASNTSSGLGDSRRGPYPSMQSANDFGPMISEGQTE